MKRQCYIIESENGVGLYLSKYLAEENLRYLTKENENFFECNTYEEGKNYIFRKYKYDAEMHLENFRVNRTLYRDKSGRRYFFVQSRTVIGYGIDETIQLSFQGIFGINPNESVIEVDTEREAIACARRGFVEEYGNPAYYYAGELYPGESIAFEEMLWYNRLCMAKPSFYKIYGSRK